MNIDENIIDSSANYTDIDNINAETSNSEDCSVCLCKLDENSYTTNCNHTFCKDCIEGWLENNHNTCPLCRQEIRECMHNSENMKIKIYMNNINNNTQIIQTLRRDNRILKNVLQKYNCSIFVFLGLFIWNKWNYYNVIQNYDILYEEYSELQNKLDILNTSYLDCLDKEECVYEIHEIKGDIPISVYSYQSLLGICSVPANYLLSCILNS